MIDKKKSRLQSKKNNQQPNFKQQRKKTNQTPDLYTTNKISLEEVTTTYLALSGYVVITSSSDISFVLFFHMNKSSFGDITRAVVNAKL